MLCILQRTSEMNPCSTWCHSLSSLCIALMIPICALSYEHCTYTRKCVLSRFLFCLSSLLLLWAGHGSKDFWRVLCGVGVNMPLSSWQSGSILLSLFFHRQCWSMWSGHPAWASRLCFWQFVEIINSCCFYIHPARWTSLVYHFGWGDLTFVPVTSKMLTTVDLRHLIGVSHVVMILVLFLDRGQKPLYAFKSSITCVYCAW